MSTYPTTYKARIKQEIEQMPEEYLPLLLEMIHLTILALFQVQ